MTTSCLLFVGWALPTVGTGLLAADRSRLRLAVGDPQLTFTARRVCEFGDCEFRRSSRKSRGGGVNSMKDSMKDKNPDPAEAATRKARKMTDKRPEGTTLHSRISVVIVACCCGILVIAAWAPVARAQLILSALAVIAVWFRPPDK
jgi:hypothetical protein